MPAFYKLLVTACTAHSTRQSACLLTRCFQGKLSKAHPFSFQLLCQLTELPEGVRHTKRQVLYALT